MFRGELQAAVVVEDETRRILLVNQDFCDLFGIADTPASLIGSDGAGIVDRALHRCINPKQPSAHTGSAAGEGTTHLTLTSGRVLAMDQVPVTVAGQLAGQLWTFWDLADPMCLVPEGDDVRAFYERVLESLPAQLAVFSTDGTYEYASPSAIRDPNTRAWIVGRTDSEYGALRGLPPEVIERRRERLAHVAATREAVEFEESFPRRDGDVRHFRRYLSPMLDRHGNLANVLGHGLDITDLKRVEAELREAQRRAEALGAAKERFLANMSHELRTPLTAVVGTAFLLQDTELDHHQQQLVSAMRAGAETLLSLINDILDLTKIGADAIRFEQLRFDLPRLVEGLLETVGYTAASKKLRLTVEIDQALPREAIGDPTRLQQVLLNLVGNAIKFTERGSVHVVVRPGESPSPEEVLVEFAVSDTGLGIAADRLDHIFHVFTQEDDNTTRRFGGSGLGLSIVRELVTRQRGTVTVESAPGKGSTFVVRLPFGRVSGHRTPPGVDVIPETPDLKGVRVLVVEDNVVNQFVVANLLKRVGADVEVRGNGRLAIDLLREARPFDIVLMDIQMPEMDGLEATRRIRDELGITPEQLPVIALTASAITEQRGRAIETGMNDFLTKPFNPGDLYRSVWRWVRRTRACRAIVAAEALPTVDLDRLLEMTGGEPDFARVLVGVYLGQASEQWQAVRSAWQAGDRRGVSEAAHKMRSAAGVVGARALHALLETIEFAAPVGEPVEVELLLRATEHEVAKVGRELPLAQVCGVRVGI